MNDVEPDERQEARLRSLLGEAGTNIAVDEPDTPSRQDMMDRDPARTGVVRRLRRAPLAVAAVLLAVLVGGVVFAIAGGDGQHVSGVPATDDPTKDAATFEMPPGEGPWRLPAEDSGIEVIEAHETFVTTNFGVAVDDPDNPTRWVAVMDGGYMFDGADKGLVESIGDGITARIMAPEKDSITGSTWMAIGNPSADPSQPGPINIAYRGVADANVIEAVKAALGVQLRWSHVEKIPAILVSQFAPLLNGDHSVDGFRYARASDADSPGLGFQARIPDGEGAFHDPVAVTLWPTELPPAVAGLDGRLTVEGSNIARRFGGSAMAYNPHLDVVDRPDLGPGAFVMTAPGIDTLTLYTPEGTSIMVGDLVLADGGTQDGTHRSGIEDKLDLVSGLVAMTRPELEAELDRRGIAGLGSGSGARMPTTTIDLPNTTVDEWVPPTVADPHSSDPPATTAPQRQASVPADGP